ncbi:hypothetical protein [Motiliproteus sp. MSK22-1]|uniref:hypothetical protein n=1 Tax=Motiliproteus sp. MSK22-1 TaxID=1897630 RepID=UPI000977A36A|nr:hypothetical protein [Motiliproteus sp. MSK22-1]OMH25575.1 hypothetical protein BGP75_23775 [Motiliproteus sp. MSK22-1]
MKKLVLTLSLIFSSNAMALDVKNTLQYTGEGVPNPAYNQKVKNIMIFQPMASTWWYDLDGTYHEDPNTGEDVLWEAGAWPPNWNTWDPQPAPYVLNNALKNPLSSDLGQPSSWLQGDRVPNSADPDQKGYVFRDKETYLKQMDLIKGLDVDVWGNRNGSTAIAVFLVPDNEANFGYGAYWKPSGQFRRPLSLFSEVKWAAWKKGIQVAPFISLNRFDLIDETPKEIDTILPDLKAIVDSIKASADAVSLRTEDGRLIVLIEGLPGRTHLHDEGNEGYRDAIINYMKSETGVLWIDNLTNVCDSNTANIYRSAATHDPIQEGEKNSCPGRYLWHYTHRNGKNRNDLSTVPMYLQERWLNITPHDPEMYPVIISQWNEYSEWKMFEPNSFDGDSEYQYLRWRFHQQP